MNNLNTGNRLATMLLDHFIMTVVIMIFVAPGMIYDIAQSFGTGGPPKLIMGNLYLNVLGFSLYFNKDIYLGRSIGKRILKLQLVDIKTNKPASPLRCLVRNVTIVLWPIEVIAALINNERRIGDFVAGTKLMTYDPEQHHAAPNWTSMLIALFVGMLITYFVLFYPVALLTK